MTALNRLLPAGVLLTLGAVICTLFLSGRIKPYLIPKFQWFTIACGFALLVLAILVLLAPDAGRSGSAPSRSLWKQSAMALFLTAPVVLTLAHSKDGFSATAVMNRNYIADVAQLPTGIVSGNAGPAISDGESEGAPGLPRNERGDLKAEVVDFLYAAQLPDMRATFENKQVEIVGQLVPAKENNPRGDRYDLVRMLMMCCAADVQPIALPIHPRARPDVPDMTWVKISGKATFPVVGGQRRPLIENATVEQTAPPEDTYLY